MASGTVSTLSVMSGSHIMAFSVAQHSTYGPPLQPKCPFGYHRIPESPCRGSRDLGVMTQPFSHVTAGLPRAVQATRLKALTRKTAPAEMPPLHSWRQT